ncbi:LOW QUALITY PROTEIN: hypothetical protein PHMEG_00022758 [Phytophthora megakarya]|uniref:Uncharacterized protein n=1 Tax=Phytophthora megakarya TaxID=4795 RepID=A0A225VK99_9STRA|nr:LOW QUALITY PROTEIN: hypothetical protein PHMEG_00022758 [Phytophthora megakarya]
MYLTFSAVHRNLPPAFSHASQLVRDHRVNLPVQDDENDFYVQRPDAIRRLGFLPERKATRLIGRANSDGGIYRARDAQNLCESIRLLRLEYLRKPTQDDLDSLLAENNARGFPGMKSRLYSLDLDLDELPYGLGAFLGKEKSTTVILEVVASKYRWICQAFYGMTGANNNLNVLERSPLVYDLRLGGIYSERCYLQSRLLPYEWYLHTMVFFQSTISAPQGNKHKRFVSNKKRSAKMLNAHLVYYSNGFEFWLCHLWKAGAMNDVMLTCILLHNTIVEDELPCDALNNAYLLDDG